MLPALGIPFVKALTALGVLLAAGANAAKYAAGVPGSTKQLAFNFGKDAAAQGVKENIARAGIGAIRDQATKEAGKGGIMRMAGDKLGDFGKFFINNAGDTKTEVALRLAPDLAFGVLGGAMTPGDLGDKLIAGTTQAAGGALGGIGLAGLARKRGANPGIQTLVDMGGSIAGDFIGMNVGDSLMRIKGGGMTPYEKQYALQDEARKQQILDNF